MEKQIEEHIATIKIKKELCENACDLCKMWGKGCMPERMAKKLAEKGYRKVEQGEWKEQNDGTHYCSACGHDATQNYEGIEICGVACAYCGAIMKGN